MIKRQYSYFIAGAIWGIPGINIAVKGFRAYLLMESSDIWWLVGITIAVALFFFIIFRKVSRRYTERISTLPERVMIWQIFPPKGWILLLFMMGLGIAFKYIPGIPIAFTASFYSGLGPMLVVAAVRFMAAARVA